MTLLNSIAIGAGVLALAAAATLLLPRTVEVTRSAMVSAPADRVLALAASNTGYQTFNPYASVDPNLIITPFGPERGVGSGFHFDGKDGKGSQTVSKVTPTSVTYAIDLGAMGQPTQVIHAVQEGADSQITWVMTADMGMNPIGRVMGLFMDRMIGKTFDRGLANLKTAI